MLCCVKQTSIAVAIVLVLGCSGSDPPSREQQNSTIEARTAAAPPQTDELVAGPFQFVDIAKSAGIHFRHYSPLTEQRHVRLVMGSGIGWFDFDRDGWPDLFCCQGAAFEGTSQDEPPSNALFCNRAGKTFSEVTRQAGLIDTGYSMGIAAADYDNDGFADLCLTGYGHNTLQHNNGDGTFTEVELPQRSFPGRLSASCAWADIDADGNLDLYVTNYAKLGPEDYPICEHTAAGKTIHIACHPSNLDRMPDLLYHNTGDGEFADVSSAAGIVAGDGRQGLGVVAADLDHDGDTDFYVGNDTTPNY
ncbi:MAG: VCBS repeat-containing protein, partial [Planctomycetota bacterium]